MVSAANNYRLATVSTALQRFSRGLESVSLSPHGTSSRGIKRLWRLDFAQDILASLASLALEVDQSLQHVGSELPPVNIPRPQKTLATLSRWRRLHLIRSLQEGRRERVPPCLHQLSLSLACR